MSNKQKKSNTATTLMGAALVGAFGITGWCMYSITSSVVALKNEVADLRTEIVANENRQLSPKELRNAVADSLEQLAQKKKQDQLKAKYAQYDQAAEIVSDKSIYGNVNARFTLVEFSDLECSFCKKFHKTLKQLVDSSKGNVNWQWKHLPLSFHNPAAKRQALASECIRNLNGNQGFWVFIDDVFQQSRSNGHGVPNLAAVVEGVGADVDQVQKCMREGRYSYKIEQEAQIAANNGITGTPATFVVDNTTGKSQLLTGIQPPQAIMAAIRKMMAEQAGSGLMGNESGS